jgi:hypothetical protein
MKIEAPLHPDCFTFTLPWPGCIPPAERKIASKIVGHGFPRPSWLNPDLRTPGGSQLAENLQVSASQRPGPLPLIPVFGEGKVKSIAARQARGGTGMISSSRCWPPSWE